MTGRTQLRWGNPVGIRAPARHMIAPGQSTHEPGDQQVSKSHSRLFAGALLVAALLVAGPARAADAAPNDDGLVKVQVKNVDSVLRRPGVDWGSYTRVKIAPVQVSFSKSWNPRDYGSFGLRGSDVDRIRRDLANLTLQVFSKVLGEGGYAVVQEAGEGVLEVEPNIVNLYINAPDTMDAGRSRSYVLSAGEMTLALELRDSVTGTLLAEARDRKRGPEHSTLQVSNRVVNRQEAERALRVWAGQLKTALDSTRSAP